MCNINELVAKYSIETTVGLIRWRTHQKASTNDTEDVFVCMWGIELITVGKFSFVNRTITDWSPLPQGVTGTSLVKTHIFRKRVRKIYR
jgi:hypothetical protein